MRLIPVIVLALGVGVAAGWSAKSSQCFVSDAGSYCPPDGATGFEYYAVWNGKTWGDSAFARDSFEYGQKDATGRWFRTFQEPKETGAKMDAETRLSFRRLEQAKFDRERFLYTPAEVDAEWKAYKACREQRDVVVLREVIAQPGERMRIEFSRDDGRSWDDQTIDYSNATIRARVVEAKP